MSNTRLDDAIPGRPFDSAGVTIRIVEAGAGEPVVLLHSFTGSFERAPRSRRAKWSKA
jgi:hypothetical protein